MHFTVVVIWNLVLIRVFGLSSLQIAMFLWHVANLQTIRLDAHLNTEKFSQYFENIFWIIGRTLII